MLGVTETGTQRKYSAHFKKTVVTGLEKKGLHCMWSMPDPFQRSLGVMLIHRKGVSMKELAVEVRMHVNRILYVTSFSLTCSSDDPLSRDVFQCLVRSSLDHRAESHRVCSAASVMTMYGQQSRVHTRASSHSSLAS